MICFKGGVYLQTREYSEKEVGQCSGHKDIEWGEAEWYISQADVTVFLHQTANSLGFPQIKYDIVPKPYDHTTMKLGGLSSAHNTKWMDCHPDSEG